MGLAIDDTEWDTCMSEATIDKMPRELRTLFGVILVNCNIMNPGRLWTNYKDKLTEDYISAGNSSELAENIVLFQLRADLDAAGMKWPDGPDGLPVPREMLKQPMEVDENPQPYAHEGQRMVQQLNEGQRHAFDFIMAAVNDAHGTQPRYFFIDGPGGTGKTFLYTTIINVLRGMGKCVLSMAWTGIAALLLPGGRTCHNAFVLPLKWDDTSRCGTKLKHKKFLLAVDVIIWDEAPMASSDALAAIDSELRDIMRMPDMPFGGKVMVLGGDYRQVLPVIPRATRLQIVRKSLKSSPLSQHFQTIALTRNMRARPEEIDFARWLLDMGNGDLPRPTNPKSEYSIALPSQCVSENVIEELFPLNFNPNEETMRNRLILTPLNEDAQLMNEKILDRFVGAKKTFKSIDTVNDPPPPIERRNQRDVVDDPNRNALLQQMYPTEFLNSVALSGLPPHKLNLKKGAIVMMMRNLCIAQGLCNGTRLIVEEMQTRVIRARIISGAFKGTVHFIPRITLTTEDDPDVPFNLCRRQFPIKLAYAMTINKAQGQTADKVGLYLRNPVFTHGQLYVACSRVRSYDSLRIQVVETERQGKVDNDTQTDNIVFKEIL